MAREAERGEFRAGADDRCAYPDDCDGVVDCRIPFASCNKCFRPHVVCEQCRRPNRRWAKHCHYCKAHIITNLDQRRLDVNLSPGELFKDMRWQLPIKLENPTPLLAHGGVLVFEAKKRLTLVVNAFSGEVIKRLETECPWSSYAVTDSRGILLGLAHQLRRLDADTFELAEEPEWELPDDSMRLTGHPLVVGDRAYVTAQNAQGLTSLFSLPRATTGASAKCLFSIRAHVVGPIELDNHVVVFSTARAWVIDAQDELQEAQDTGDFLPDPARGRWTRHGKAIIISPGAGKFRRFLANPGEFFSLPSSDYRGSSRIAVTKAVIVVCSDRGLAMGNLQQPEEPLHWVVDNRGRAGGKSFHEAPCVKDNWVFAVSVDGVLFMVQVDLGTARGKEHQRATPGEGGGVFVGEPVYCDATLGVHYREKNKLFLRGFALSRFATSGKGK